MRNKIKNKIQLGKGKNQTTIKKIRIKFDIKKIKWNQMISDEIKKKNKTNNSQKNENQIEYKK